MPLRMATKRSGFACNRHTFFEACDTDQNNGKSLVNEPSADGSTDCPEKILRTAIEVIRDVAMPAPIALLALITT